MYLLRLKLGKQRGTRYGTAPEDRLQFDFGRKYQRVRKIGGMFHELRQVGWDKSRVEIRWRAGDTVVNDRGLTGLYPGNTHFRLLDRHDHVRRLHPQDEGRLRAKDRLITEREADLRRLRDERAEMVKAAWRRAEKIPIYELEDQAARNLPKDEPDA